MLNIFIVFAIYLFYLYYYNKMMEYNNNLDFPLNLPIYFIHIPKTSEQALRYPIIKIKEMYLDIKQKIYRIL
jgi:hypothetical protein